LDGLNILIVSSGSVEAVVLGRRLKARGASVSRSVGVDSLPHEGRFDCVLLDQRLGDDTLDAVVARVKDRCDRLVLVVTPAARGEVARWREHGVNGWLVSPVREASLVMQVRTSSPGIASGDPLTDKVPEARVLPAMRPLTVLLAEDNEINALLARRLLEKLGHRPVWVQDGRAAVAAALDLTAPVDLVLMDMQMPELDGLAATRAIRAAEGHERHLPIIALTANAFVEDREAALAAGMDGFVTKPLNREHLAEAIALLVPGAIPEVSLPTKRRGRRASRAS